VHKVLVDSSGLDDGLRRTDMITTEEVSEVTDQATPPAEIWTPEAVIEGLRVLRTHIAEVTPMTTPERKRFRDRARASDAVVQASIIVIDALDNVSQAVGQPADEVREMYRAVRRWTAVEAELRALLNGVAGANLVRRRQVVLIAAQASSIGAQLARDPANAVLIPQLEEVKRLRRFTRRRKAAQTPDSPQGPATSETPHA
jgi:hypothetical protein